MKTLEKDTSPLVGLSAHLTRLLRPGDFPLVLESDHPAIGRIVIESKGQSLAVVVQVGDRVQDEFLFLSLPNVRERMQFEILSPVSKDYGVISDLEVTIGVFGVRSCPQTEEMRGDRAILLGLAARKGG